jgi:hypothetical protein
MWFPKSPIHWAGIVIVPFIVCALIWGIVIGFWITVFGVAIYSGVFYARQQRLARPAAPVIAPQSVTADGQAVPASVPSQAVVQPQRSSSQDGFVKASYDVPHCKYEETEEGFIVTFNKAGKSMHRVLNQTSQKQSGMQAVGSLIALSVVGTVRLAQMAGEGTRIEVTRDAVIIDGKKMSRDDFGNFHVSSTYNGAHLEGAVATLGYQFGSRSFEFGGTWDERQANEVAASLNHHLRRTPRAGEENRASPASLRAARPTDF